MEIELLNAQTVSKRLRGLIDGHDEIHLAVAWGFNGPLADCLLNNRQKFASVTFGVAFCQTDPNLIARLVGVKNAFVADGGKATFHPKIYYFRTGETAEAIVGSSNFTMGGLDRNWEACVHAKGPADAPFFNQLRDCLTEYNELRRTVTAELVNTYRTQFEAAKQLRKPRNPILPRRDGSSRPLMPPLVQMSWTEYTNAVRSSRHHEFDTRLSLLRTCQRLFASVSSFAQLSGLQWKAIAGTITEKQNREAGLGEHNWAWFGSMAAMGNFANRIVEQDASLARAMDCIPRHGDVTEEHYQTFCEHFLRAFENSSRTGGVSTATRLLAMKRPDSFVCVSSPNKLRLSEALAFSRTTLSLKNYWERVIEPIRISSWYNAPRPAGSDAELWDGRVAMLDAIYFDPD
ncbi:putative HKD family nuclease [Bosea sp. LC85]|uniref:phospholipase D-like domain-containing protein n=1 Tax=Bosea sp. LC85 TaxID=1502851 RepID=UPI0004E45087|nr:phospholipase D-like domain-containing protein [Bosea sp. LC85]KFC65281.1 putative HKD family nuclease [Bosea sp. LC85]